MVLIEASGGDRCIISRRVRRDGAAQEVPAGNVVAIAGLEAAILKSATVSDSPAARPLAPMLFQVHPPAARNVLTCLRSMLFALWFRV